jgi:hypothetical protein
MRREFFFSRPAANEGYSRIAPLEIMCGDHAIDEYMPGALPGDPGIDHG